MRILVCSLEAPLPPSNGLRLQLLALIPALRERGHDVRVLAFRSADQAEGSNDTDLKLLERPSVNTAGKVRVLPTAAMRGLPLGVAELTARIRPPLREELDWFKPEVVHVTTQELAMLGDDIGKGSVLAALDAWYRNVEADIVVATGARRRLLPLQLRWVRRFEATRYRRFSRVVVVSDEDRDALKSLDPTMPVEVIPNGVDLEFFGAPVEGHSADLDRDRIVFTGVMKYPPNVAAAEFLVKRVLPLVRAERLPAHVVLVGRDPAPQVEALASPGEVEVTGEVDDLRPWLAGSRVYVCPMVSGTGIKNKLLEAMAAGLPCVSTPLGAQGLQAEPGRDLLIAHDERELAAATSSILRDDELAARVGTAGQAFVRAQHSWAAVAEAYEHVYTQARADAGGLGPLPGSR